MEKLLKIFMAFLFAIIIASSITYYVNLDFYQKLVQEDGILEYLTAFILLVNSMLLLYRLVKIGRFKRYKWIFFNVVLILGLFFGFGEEISWGQRIFSVDSNSFFMENNIQKETNLHNLEVKGVNINRLIFSNIFSVVFGFYFLLGLISYRRIPKFRSLVDQFGVPIPKSRHSIILILLSTQIFLTADLRKWEAWECLFVLTLLWVFIDPFNKKEKLIPARR